MNVIKKLKSAIGFDENNSEFKSMLDKSVAEQNSIADRFYEINFSKIPTFKRITKLWDDSKKAEFIIYLCKTTKKLYNSTVSSKDPRYKKYLMAKQYIRPLLKSNLKLSEEELISIFSTFKETKSDYADIYDWPIDNYFKLIEFNFQQKKLPRSIKIILEYILSVNQHPNHLGYKNNIKMKENIKALLNFSENPEKLTTPTYFIGQDAFTEFANHIIDTQNKNDRNIWYKLVAHSQGITGSKPSQKFLKGTKILIEELGIESFRKVTFEWFNYLAKLKNHNFTHTFIYQDEEHSSIQITYLDVLNSNALKGFVWMSPLQNDKNIIQILSRLAERCFKKLPGIGQAAASLGNACLLALFSSERLDGIAELSKLKIKVKQISTLNLIEKYINTAAEKLGITALEIEDLAVDDFGLKDYKIIEYFDEIKCEIEIISIGKSTLRWFKKDGSEQKTTPQFVKEKFAEKFKEIKNIQKQIDLTTSVQKERFDRMLRSTRKIPIKYFKEKYFDHGLLSFIINKTIFNFSNGKETKTAICIKNQWIDLTNKQVDIEKFTEVSLWHPVTVTTNEVQNWRKFLLDGKIQQPFKQAFREIYLLTDAEVNTRTYSNRMAAHILKQHQYVTLAKGRNWKAKLIGAWDGGDQDTAQLYLDDYNLKVEFWINAVEEDDQHNESGIWNYIATDQIRFISTETNEVVELINIPQIAFSEAMRDVDLFVGVASVGNDPTWTDSGGLPAYRTYWQEYSFGNLTEIAKNRKEILKGVIPRLKIASICSINDKFFVVKGKLRTYKIHIGSTNILMEPNDQYLCIVPDRSKMKDNKENIFLPFEGDNGLSLIISKVFLLAEDDKITDTTITSQINRN